MKTIQIKVSGRVQGVCFRAATQKQAEQLGIMGIVKNNTDGSVNIVARHAKKEILDIFINWCHKGPIMAKVTDVAVKEFTTTEKFTQFEIL